MLARSKYSQSILIQGYQNVNEASMNAMVSTLCNVNNDCYDYSTDGKLTGNGHSMAQGTDVNNYDVNKSPLEQKIKN